MTKIIDGRGTGKTMKLLKEAYEKDATVVCAQPLAIRNKANYYGFYGLNVISYEDYFQNPPLRCVIDELEGFAACVCKKNLSSLLAYSQSIEN